VALPSFSVTLFFIFAFEDKYKDKDIDRDKDGDKDKILGVLFMHVLPATKKP
jgi:hypothetical protein